MNKLSGKSFITILIYLYIIIPLINSQENQNQTQTSESKKKFHENVEKFEQINVLYTNITEKMTDIKYNIILKIKYKFLKSKHEDILKIIDKVKTSINIHNDNDENLLKDIYKLNEYITSYKKSCHKIVSLFESFENLKKTIINLIKIFFLTLGILILIVIIISGIILYYYYKKRKSYSILKEEINQSNFTDMKNSELDRIKEQPNNNNNKDKKKGKKRKKKGKKIDEKTENIEVLDDK